MLLNWPTFVLQRRINVPLAAVERLLCSPRLTDGNTRFDLDTEGLSVTLDRPFGLAFPPFGLAGASWSVPATVRTGHGRKVVELEIEINAWDPSSTEVVVRPRARHPYRWGGRRLRRYFEVAHLTADALAQFFGLRANPPTPARRLTPLARSAMN
jgi:hypothetical protein